MTGGYLTSHLNMLSDTTRISIETVNAGAYAKIVAGPLHIDALGNTSMAGSAWATRLMA